MYHPPFHRRILPWIFTVTFFVTAPAVIFYTAGYRWNPKKEKVERQGTLILDTQPNGARIFIDDVDIDKTTPLTLQNVTPGRHHIHFEYPGYTSWEKRLDVYPERVTFADTVHLWKKSSAQLLSSISAKYIETVPEETSFIITTENNKETSFNLWSPGKASDSLFRISFTINERPLFFWRDNGRFALVELHNSADGKKSSWMIDAARRQTAVELPEGVYRWNGSRLQGVAGTDFIDFNPGTSQLTRTPLAANVFDQADDLKLTSNNSSDRRILRENSDQRGFILPSGNWTFFSQESDSVLLRDGRKWLTIDFNTSPPNIDAFEGDTLRALTLKRRTHLLSLRENEVWIWENAESSELILRESSRVTETAWHEDGADIFVTASSTLFAVNLDGRDGRIRTPLATFDEISDFAVSENGIAIAGRLGEQQGIWELEVE